MKLNDRDPHGDPEGTVANPQGLRVNASLVILVKDCADMLERHYPGWGWAVGPDERGGIINIFCVKLSMSSGYTLHTKALQFDLSRRSVLKAGGEILERFGQKRGAYNHAHFMASKQKHSRAGMRVQADVSDFDKRTQRQFRTRAIQDGITDGTIAIITDTDIQRARRERMSA